MWSVLPTPWYYVYVDYTAAGALKTFMEKISRRQFFKRAGLSSTFGLVATYPFFIERYIVLINHYRIAVPNLPAAFSGLRIVHLTDLHYGPFEPLAFITHVIHRANALKPDLILCTGDYVLEKKERIDQVWPVLSQLSASMGVYSVLGNHDHWADTDRSDYWMKRTGQDLRHKTIRLEREGHPLWLGGAGDFWTDHKSLDVLLQDIPETDCRIVLAHNPDTADTPHTSRIDLMLSGHTHGGQVNIPFVGTPILPVENKDYSSGLVYSKRREKVFISKGIGWAVFPVRFNCAPEIAVLDLVPESVELQ